MSQRAKDDAQQAYGPTVSGTALLATVKAAETPLVGDAVKQILFAQLGLDKLFAIDLRPWSETAPASLPTHEHGPSDANGDKP